MALGTLVASPSFRHPLTTASQAMTLDHLSGGRFILGVGSGAPGPDTEALGGPAWSAADRAERLAEFVTLADEALRGRLVDFRGRHFTAAGVRLTPGCVQRPRVPFAVAAAGPRGLRLAARYGQYWVTIGRPGRRPSAGRRRTAGSGGVRHACALSSASSTPPARTPAATRRTCASSSS